MYSHNPLRNRSAVNLVCAYGLVGTGTPLKVAGRMPLTLAGAVTGSHTDCFERQGRSEVSRQWRNCKLNSNLNTLLYDADYYHHHSFNPFFLCLCLIPRSDMLPPSRLQLRAPSYPSPPTMLFLSTRLWFHRRKPRTRSGMPASLSPTTS